MEGRETGQGSAALEAGGKAQHHDLVVTKPRGLRGLKCKHGLSGHQAARAACCYCSGSGDWERQRRGSADLGGDGERK